MLGLGSLDYRSRIPIQLGDRRQVVHFRLQKILQTVETDVDQQNCLLTREAWHRRQFLHRTLHLLLKPGQIQGFRFNRELPTRQTLGQSSVLPPLSNRQ